MSDHLSPEVQALQRYENSGDIRPSVESLKNMLEIIDAPDMGVRRKLAAADMCIDLACALDDENGADQLVEAGRYLVEAGSEVKSTDEPPQTVAAITIEAGLKVAELSNWRAEVTGQPFTVTYDQLLDTLEMLTDPSEEPINYNATRLLDSVPLLVGTRSMRWIGRLSLKREGRRGRSGAATNPNWSSGLVLNATSSFADPDIRLQVDRSRINQAQAYTKAGVVPITARTHGFADVLPVIGGCLRETGARLSSTFADIEIATPDQLDNIAGRIAETTGTS